MKRKAILLSCLLLVLLTAQDIITYSASSNWLNDELSLIHQEIDLLRGENRNQNIQIALLQEKVSLQDEPKFPHHHQALVKKPENTVEGSPHQPTSGGFHHHRQARPYRLLPTQHLYGRQTSDEHVSKDQEQIRRFYGQPSNCSDLSLLGYTLNGFYLVKSVANSLTDKLGLQLETVFCAFKQPEGPFYSSAVETRVGFLKLDVSRKSLSEVTISLANKDEKSSQSDSFNKINNSSSKLILHLQIKSTNIIQKSGNPVIFDNIIFNKEKSYDSKKLAFFAPIFGNYKFVFEAKVLEGKNVAFRYAGRYAPEYKNGYTLKETAPSDFKGNVVTMVVTSKLKKMDRIQIKSVGSSDKTYTLSADNSTSFKCYLLP